MSNYTANLREHILKVQIMMVILIDYGHIVNAAKKIGQKTGFEKSTEMFIKSHDDTFYYLIFYLHGSKL